MENTLEEINSRLNEAEDWISNLEDKVSENTQSEQKKEFKKEDSLRDLWNNIKHNNICIIQVPEGEERARNLEPMWRNNDWKLP